jgi:hypothetical protein
MPEATPERAKYPVAVRRWEERGGAGLRFLSNSRPQGQCTPNGRAALACDCEGACGRMWEERHG